MRDDAVSAAATVYVEDQDFVTFVRRLLTGVTFSAGGAGRVFRGI